MTTQQLDDTWQIRARRRRVLGGDGEHVIQAVGFETVLGARARAPLADATNIAERVPVSAAMTSDVLCVREDVSIEALAALLVERGISGVPVVDDSGRPIGVVSKTDLVRAQHEDGESFFADDESSSTSTIEALGDGLHGVEVTRGTVADVMTPLALTIYEYASLSRASALMAREGLHRLVVVASDGRVTGILTPLDVLRWLAGFDGYVVAHPDDRAQR